MRVSELCCVKKSVFSLYKVLSLAVLATRVGRTMNDIYLHWCLSSTFLTSPVNDNTVHDFVLSIHVVLDLPRVREPALVVPCIISVSKQSPFFLVRIVRPSFLSFTDAGRLPDTSPISSTHSLVLLIQIKSNLFASTKYTRKTIEKHKVNTRENQRHTDYEC